MIYFLIGTVTFSCCVGTSHGLKSHEESKLSNDGSSYMVVAPKTLRTGLPYAVSVNLFKDGLDKLKIDYRENTVILEVLDNRRVRKAIAWMSNVKPGKPITITIGSSFTSKLVAGYAYRVQVVCEAKNGDEIFSVNAALQVQGKPLTPFVQTDKAKYKPENTVRFRTIVVNPELKPYTGSVQVRVEDPKRNVVQMFNETLNKGVLTKSFNLSSQPPFGSWTIRVLDPSASKKEDVLFSKYFTVDKYVLPKFDVKVEADEFIQVPDDIDVKITAKYTHGKGIAGNVKVKPQIYGYTPAGEIEKSAVLDDKGQAVVSFRFAELFRRELINSGVGFGGVSSVHFLASVTEKLTKIVRNATGTVKVYTHGVKLAIDSKPTFKPGLQSVFNIAVKTPEGKPVPDTYNPNVKLEILYKFENGSSKYYESDGQPKFSVPLPARIRLTPPINTTLVTVEAFYHRRSDADYHEYSAKKSYRAMKSPSGNFLQLKRQDPASNEAVTPGTIVTYGLTATEYLETVMLQILSRGYVIDSRQLVIDGKTGTFEVITTELMAPKAQILVYTVLKTNKEIMVDVGHVSVKGFFKNDVKVKFGEDQVEPGDKVSLIAQAAPDSLICLMAVDRSVELLESGFDVTAKDVENSITRYAHDGIINGLYASDIFEQVKLSVMTDMPLYNANRGNRRNPYYFNRPKTLSRGNGGGRIRNRNVKFRRGRGGGNGTTNSDGIAMERPTAESGIVTYSANVPDSITSWVASAMAFHETEGFGVAEDRSMISVFKEFYATTNLPYSIKRHEKFALQVLVFNYADSDVVVNVRLAEDPGFVFLDRNGRPLKQQEQTTEKQEKSINPNGTGSRAKHNVRRVNVPKNGARSVWFAISAVKVGKIPLRITANGGQKVDALRKKLRVEPEGFPVEQSKPFLIEFKSDNPTSSTVDERFREQYRVNLKSIFNRIAANNSVENSLVEGSEFAEVSMIGDLMGPILQNVDDLVRMPYGCGEQNLVNFVPTIVVTKYLNKTGRLRPSIQRDARRYMESGYQRQLSYMRNDNSFSAFGNRDRYGSTWLTAFTIRSFIEAKDIIFIDDNVIQRSCAFLDNKVDENGAVQERGAVHNKALQGGAQGTLALSAYVALTLLKCREHGARANPNRVLLYLTDNLETIQNNSYALSMVSLALQRAGNLDKEKAEQAYQMLSERGVFTNGESEFHWNYTTKAASSRTRRPWYWYRPSSLDVEATAYALLTYLGRPSATDSEARLKRGKISKWLSNQQNAYGGYSSTQDTVMAIQALGAYAEEVYSPNTDLSVTVANNGENDENTIVRQIKASGPDRNEIVLQKSDLPSPTSDVSLTVEGTGVALIQVNWKYHLVPNADAQPFSCKVDPEQREGSPNVQFEICCKYTEENSSTNMVVLEMTTVSGYKINEEELNKIPVGVDPVKRVELIKAETQANVYFDELHNYDRCISVHTEQEFMVADQKPGRIVVYDYYEPETRMESSYTNKDVKTIQEACPDCWNY